jgi:TetR/AcrR family transcriptional repressor of lmrAB and yxaGH operons
MSPDTRTRMIDAAVDALRHHGVAGMSFTDVLANSGGARGAIYHHFPDGKAQLVAEAAAHNGAEVQARLAALPGKTPVEVVDAFLAVIRPVVAESTTGSGCAVAAVALGGNGDSGQFEQIASTVFNSWITVLTERLTATGLPAGEASDLAATLITVLEGAHVLCRAAGSLEPYEQAARTVAGLLRTRNAAG